MSEPLIPKHSGYRNLKSFQLSQLIYAEKFETEDGFTERLYRVRRERRKG